MTSINGNGHMSSKDVTRLYKMHHRKWQKCLATRQQNSLSDSKPEYLTSKASGDMSCKRSENMSGTLSIYLLDFISWCGSLKANWLVYFKPTLHWLHEWLFPLPGLLLCCISAYATSSGSWMATCSLGQRSMTICCPSSIFCCKWCMILLSMRSNYICCCNLCWWS